MVTISIRPYTLSKIGLVGLTLLCLSCLSAFAQPTYVTVNSTPYDQQMIRIRPTLTAAAFTQRKLSLALVNHWIWDLRVIPYGFSFEWRTPQEVQTGAFADCKGKAVALYNAMHSRGANNVRLVIGKRLWNSRKTHAWLEWTTVAGTYILDPTINWSARPAQPTGLSSYIPFYAYSGGKKFRAENATQLFAKNQLFTGQRVASRL